MKLKTFFLSVLLTATLFCSLFTGTTAASETPSVIASGSLGESITWTLTEDGSLTVEGVGAVPNYLQPGTRPWSNYVGNIRSAVVSEGITSLGLNFLNGCYLLEQISLPASLTSIKANSFYCCSKLGSIDIPETVTSIGACAFYYCVDLSEITIPAGVMEISNNTFYGCTGLKEVRFSGEPLSIGASAFQDCSSLEEIMIPDSVTKIFSNSFYGCSAATRLYIGKHLTMIDSGSATSRDDSSVYANLFYNCPALTEITVNEENPVFDSRDHCNALIETASSTLLLGCTKSTVPEGITAIDGGAFRNCAITSLTLPEGLRSIGQFAFAGSSLETIIFPSTLETLQLCAFNNCRSLKKAAFLSDTTLLEDSQTATAYGNRHLFYYDDKITVLYGREGSTAQSYAEDFGYEFRPLDLYDSEILTIPDNSRSIKLYATSQSYTGKEITLENTTMKLDVYCHDLLLTKGTDYTVSYENNINAGTAALIITGIGGYQGVIRREFTISKAPVVLSLQDKHYTYTGKKAYPIDPPQVSPAEKAGAVTVTYYRDANCTNALSAAPSGIGIYYAKATAQETENAAFAESNVATLTIDKSSTVTLSDKTAVYTGKPIAIGKAAVNGSTADVTYTYYADAACRTPLDQVPVDVGTYYVKATVAKDKTFAAGTSNIAVLTISKAATSLTAEDKTAVYTGQPVSIEEASVKGSSGAVSYFYYTDSLLTTRTTADKDGAAGTGQAPANKGVYYVSIAVAADNNYERAAKTVTLIIADESELTKITNDDVSLAYTTTPYTGKAKSPAVTVTVDGRKLTKNTDYTLLFENNINAGTATVTVKSKGYCLGTVKKTYKITQAANSITKVTPASKSCKANTLKKKAQTFKLTAKNTFPAKTTFKLASANAKAKKYIKVASSGKVTVKKGAPKGTYKIKVKVTTAKTANYKAKSLTKTITIKVK